MKRLHCRVAASSIVTIALTALLSFTTSLQAQILVPLAGIPPITFDAGTTLTIDQWATGAIAGDGNVFVDPATIQAGIQYLEPGVIVTALATTTTDGTSANFRHNTAGGYIVSDPTGNRANLLKATLRNNSGGVINSITVSYDFGVRLTGAAETGFAPGHQAFFNLTSLSNGWTHIPEFSGLNADAPVTAALNTTGWAPDTDIYLLWVDDNSLANPDGAYSIDNFAISSVIGGVTTCVAITNQSSSITLPERGAASFSIMATGTPLAVQWYRNGSPIVGANSQTYTIPSVVYPGDNAAQFYATVSNSLCQATSVVATLTVIQDTAPPVVIRAVADVDPTTLHITFSEPLDAATINENNFTLFETGTDPDATPFISFGGVLLNPSNVLVTTDARVPGFNYSVRILDVRDASSGNNLISPNPLVVPLLATLELIGFTNNNVWKWTAQTNLFGTGWETVGYDDSDPLLWPEGPAGLGNDAGNEVQLLTTTAYAIDSAPQFFRRHFTLPARTNGLELYLRHCFEDGGVVFINGQEAGRFNVNPGVLTVATRTPLGAPGTAPISAPVLLPLTNVVSGDNVIAVVVIQTGATSSDIFMAVEVTAVVREFLSGPAKIITPPQPLTVNEGQSATLSVVAEGELPLSFQWRKGGVDLEGQTNASLTFNAALPSDAADYTVFVSNALGNTNSPIAHLTVNADLTAPVFVSAVASTNLTNITLIITDAFGLDVASVQDVSHYTVALTGGGGALTIESAVLVNGTNVVLTTSPRTQSQDYTIVLNNITDRSQAHNPVTPTTRTVLAGIVILVPDDVTLWKFDSSSNNLDGLGWQLPGYNDSAWPTALAGFTSSNALEVTTNGFELRTTNMVSPASGGPPTTYYRVPFTFPGSVANAALRIVGVVDDGLVAYINGVEAGRLRMTNASPVSFTNFTTGGSPETADVHLPLETITLTNLSGLVQGNNLLAIELHQQNITSSDAVLSIQLVAEIATFGGGTVGPPVRITRTLVGGITQITISWTGGGTLQETSALVNGGATVWVPSSRLNGVPFIPPTVGNKFYRVAQ